MIKEEIIKRDKYLNVIGKRVTSLNQGYRQNIAIIGDELVGKTSLIFEFLRNFSDPKVIPVYFETRPESLPNFAKRFIGILLYNFMSNSGIELKEDLDYLIRKSEKFIPRTIQEAKAIIRSLSQRRKNLIFTELLTLTEIIKEETSKSCVVIFDEFHNLESLSINGLYKEWARLLVTKKNTLYIIISSMKYKANTILSKNLSLLFGNFEILIIEPFDTKTSELYLKNKLGKINIDITTRNFIVHFTGGNPFYLKVISDSLLATKDNKITDALESVLFDSSGMLNQRFSVYIKRFSDASYGNDFISILSLISNSRNKIKDISHIMRKTSEETVKRINYLLELDAITRNGDFLKINDRVFGFWLKFVYQEKTTSLTFDAKSQRDKFRDCIEEMMRDFIIHTNKPVLERLSELMRLFENDIFQLGKKKIRLTHFREIKTVESGTNAKLKNFLIGRSNNNLWVMAYKPDTLTEEDIISFSRECRKYRHKLERKVIITLKDIDQNTRLRALEEKIWTWDLSNLNQIFDFYSKPWVIV